MKRLQGFWLQWLLLASPAAPAIAQSYPNRTVER